MAPVLLRCNNYFTVKKAHESKAAVLTISGLETMDPFRNYFFPPPWMKKNLKNWIKVVKKKEKNKKNEGSPKTTKEKQEK